MTDFVLIELQYLLENGQKWHSIKLSASEYFDLETNEPIELDCIPRYNHAIDYIKDNSPHLDINQIIVTKIMLIDLVHQQQRQITETFWGYSQNRLIERKDLDLNTLQIQYHELIIETQIQNNPPLWEILRLSQDNGIMTPLFHSLIQENSDGSQTETKIEIKSMPNLNLLKPETLTKQLV